MKKADCGVTKFVKALSLTATICTVIMWIFLWIMSAIPGDSSADMSNGLLSALDSLFNVSEKVTRNSGTKTIRLSTKDKKDYYFKDETVQLKVTCYPSTTTDTEVTYSSNSKGMATVDENGLVTFGSKSGTVTITAKLKSDETIKYATNFTCYGENMFEEGHEERLTINLYDSSYTELSDEDELSPGSMYYIGLNSRKTYYGSASYSLSDDSVAYIVDGIIYPLKAGTATLTAVVTDGESEATLTLPITVAESDYVPISTIKFNDIAITDRSKASYMSFIEIEEGRRKDDYACTVTIADSRIVSVDQTILKGLKVGETTLTFTSVFNPDVVVEVPIKINYRAISSLKIVGNDYVVPGSETTYTESSTLLRGYTSTLTWSVVSGNATITDDGVLTCNFYGTVVIRCESSIDSSLVAEKTITVSMFTTASGFVRKILGHMGLSAVLGVGIFATLLLLSKRKKMCLLSPVLCFIYAGGSELIQSVVPGRSCKLNDVFIDFMGCLIGIAVAIILFALLILIWHIASKGGCKKLVYRLKHMNRTNIFKKAAETDIVLEEAAAAENLKKTD